MSDAMGMEPRLPASESSERSEARTRRRDSLFLMARLTLTESAQSWDVRVRNLSEGGLMADVPRPVAVGTPVEVELRGIGSVPGRIAWFAESRVGVALDQRIDPKLARKPVATRAAKR